MASDLKWGIGYAIGTTLLIMDYEGDISEYFIIDGDDFRYTFLPADLA